MKLIQVLVAYQERCCVSGYAIEMNNGSFELRVTASNEELVALQRRTVLSIRRRLRQPIPASHSASQSRLTEGLVSFRIKTFHASPLLELFERIIRHAPIFSIPCHGTDPLSRVNPGS